jgi:hypothetical protein
VEVRQDLDVSIVRYERYLQRGTRRSARASSGREESSGIDGPMDPGLLFVQVCISDSRGLRVRGEGDRVCRDPVGLAAVASPLYLLQYRPGREEDRWLGRSPRFCRRLQRVGNRLRRRTEHNNDSRNDSTVCRAIG